ncbi:MAG TPA: VOC family protein [Polyangia bacterium]|nr:VOC family protein [Polyangia bacterium]
MTTKALPTKDTEVVPRGYHTVTPWIIARGASELIGFMEKAFGAEETKGSRILDADGLIGHVEVRVGDSVIMLFDAKPAWPMTASFLRLYVANGEAVYQQALGAGAISVTEPTTLFFGEKVARVRDAWGNIWWIHQRLEEVAPAELERRMKDPTAMKAMMYVQASLDQAMREPAR